jgi:hypothetical protein
VYNSIYAWAERQGFERDGSSSYDKYYRGITCKTGSNIRFEFTMRLVDANQTKLEINTLYYEGKDEFKLILQSLMDVLDSLKTATPRAAQEKVPYPKTLVLNCSVDTVADAISGWIGQMSFKGDQTRGDQFYRYLGCRTGSGIRLWFEMRLIGENKTRLLINASGYANKEEFPMILKSFEDILAGLDTETGESLQSN